MPPGDVNNEAAALDEVSVAARTLIRPHTCMDSHVRQQVGVAGKVLVAHLAQVRLLPQVSTGVCDPQVSFKKPLGAVLALEAAPHHMTVLAVAVQRVHGRKPLPAKIANEGAGFLSLGVDPAVVDVQAALPGKDLVTDLTVVPPVSLRQYPMLLHQVRIQVEALREHGPAGGAQKAALVGVEKQAAVVLAQRLSCGAKVEAGDLALWVDADVAGDVSTGHAVRPAAQAAEASHPLPSLGITGKKTMYIYGNISVYKENSVYLWKYKCV